MRTVNIEEYGEPEVLKIKNIPKPTIRSGDILVRIKATAVTAADSRIRGARFPKGFGFLAKLVFGITKPRIKILGSTYSGIVEQVGKNVSQFHVGDEVCGMTGVQMGTYAEYIRISKYKSIAFKPKSVAHEDAAGLLFGGTAALYFVRDKLGVKKGETVVINGASGAVGTNAIQLAKYYGAKVTGVTSSKNSTLVQRLGAEDIIDYAKQDLVSAGKKFDVVLDTVGNISPQAAKTLLTKKGRAGLMVGTLWEGMVARDQVMTGTATEKKEDIEFLLELTEQGKIKVVIDKIYELDDIVAAHRYADSGSKVGNVIVRM